MATADDPFGTTTDDGKVRLRARNLKDLAVISALVQDAIVPLGDIAYLQEEKLFVLALNRFRWECRWRGDARCERVHSGLRFDGVTAVKSVNIDRKARGQFLSILTITHDDGVVVIHCAGGGALRLEVESLNAALEDLSEAWPTQWAPRHKPE